MHLRNGVEKMIRKGKIMNNEMPDDIYIQLGENRIGTEICLRKWSKEPFEGGTKYARADNVLITACMSLSKVNSKIPQPPKEE